MGRGSNIPLLGQELGESPAVSREQERGAALGGAAATTAAPSWAPYSAANAPNHRGPLFHRGHPTPRLSPHRLREGPLLSPLHLYASWRGGPPRSRHCTHSTVTWAPCSPRHHTTTTIATISKVSRLLCKECPRTRSREARSPVVRRRLAYHTLRTRSWPISPSSPSMGFRVATPTWWSGVPPPFLLSPNIARTRRSPSTTRSLHTLSEGEAALAPSPRSRCHTPTPTPTHTPKPTPDTCTRHTQAATPPTKHTSSSARCPTTCRPLPSMRITQRPPARICPSTLLSPLSPLPHHTPLYPPLRPPLPLLHLSPLTPPSTPGSLSRGRR